MKKVTIVVIAVIAVIGLLLGFGFGSYNNLVSAEENVAEKLSDIDVYMKRRADLIPNLVSTVKGYAAHETEIYTELANARAALAGSTTAEDKFAANDALDSAISRLLVVVENYPDLKASEQFKSLQDQLEGSENRIATARQDYNQAIKAYNVKVRRFPGNIIASIFGFETKTMYEAPAGSEQAPTVEF